MERSREWVKKVTEQGFAEVVSEGSFWADVRFFHRTTGYLVHTKTVVYTD